jgi:SAM-dependent methyltransferase
VLDAPCGAGRLLPFLRERGHRVLWADAARAMLREARQREPAPPPAALADALSLPFRDGACDGVLSFRFLHHLPRERAKAAVAEACRVARRFVVVSFFHPCSAHHLQRRLRDLARGRAPSRHALTLGRLRRWCRAHGFRLHGRAAELPFARDLWVASFVRGPE